MGIGGESQFTVTISFPSLPPGVTISPPGPFVLPSFINAYSFLIQADASVPTGPVAINIASTNGSVNHTNSLPVTVGPVAPFALKLSSGALSLTPGSPGNIQATIVPSSGTAPDVSLSFGTIQLAYELPAPAVSGSGSGPFTLTFFAAIDSVPISNAVTFITARANSGDTATAMLDVSLSVPFPSIAAQTRSTFVRTDDPPAGAVYDMARKLVFATFPDLNEVRVFSSTDVHLVATIPVEQPGAIDETVDGKNVLVGGLAKVISIDPDKLQVTHSTAVNQSGTYSAIPVQLATLSTGEVLILSYVGGHVFIWNPVTGTMTLRDPPNSPSAPSGPFFVTRSGDHSAVLMPAGLGYVLYNASSDSYSPVSNSLNATTAATFALNTDGSRIARFVAPNTFGPSTLSTYDSDFNLLDSIDLSGNGGAENGIFSLDGSTIYAFGDAGVAYDASTLQPKGLFALGTQVTVSDPFTIDETGMVFGLTSARAEGLVVTDVSHPGAIAPDNSVEAAGYTLNGLCTNSVIVEPGTQFNSVPYIDFPDALCFGAASLTKGVVTGIVGSGFDPKANYRAYVGAPPGASSTVPATNISVVSPQELDLAIPAGTTPGPANLTLTRSDGWYGVIPDAISYGPVILATDPNVVPSAGQVTIDIYGYGFLMPPNVGPVTVTVGGRPATVIASGPLVNNVDGVTPIDTLHVTVPPGNAGAADVTVTTAYGSVTLTGGVEYLASAQVYPLAGHLNGIVYDQPRQRLYVANTDHNRIEIFDLGSQAFLAPISTGNAPMGLALTPDGTELAVLNSSDTTVSVIDPTLLKVTATEPVYTAQDQNCAPAPQPSVSALETHRVLVTVACSEGTGPVNLRLLNLDTGSVSCLGTAGCDSSGTNVNPGFVVTSIASTSDGSEAFLSDGLFEIGLMDLLHNTLLTANGVQSQGTSVAVDTDRNIFSASLGTYNPQLSSVSLSTEIANFQPGSGGSAHNQEALNPSGSLLFISTGGIDVFDVHRGRLVLRLALPEQAADDQGTIALDETGTKLFLLTRSGITVAQLSATPLSIASLTPASAAPGAQVTIRGSGFQSGATVAFDGNAAAATFVDSMTLQATVPSLPNGAVQVTVTNPGGQSYSFDAAFAVN